MPERLDSVRTLHFQHPLFRQLRQRAVFLPFVVRVLHHPVFRDSVLVGTFAELVLVEHGDQRLQRLPVRLDAAVGTEVRQQVRGRIPFGVDVAGMGGTEVEEQVFLHRFAQPEQFVAVVQLRYLVALIPVFESLPVESQHLRVDSGMVYRLPIVGVKM